MSARLSAFVVWALVASSVVFWGLRWFAPAPAAPTRTVAAVDTASQRADLTRLFGAPVVAAAAPAAVPAPESSRFQLTGVVAPKGRHGPAVALIAVDGQAPRAYRLGAAVDGELVLQSVTHRSVALGPARGEPSVVLEMPLLPEPATGTLPSAPALLPPGGAPAMGVPQPGRLPPGQSPPGLMPPGQSPPGLMPPPGLRVQPGARAQPPASVPLLVPAAPGTPAVPGGAPGLSEPPPAADVPRPAGLRDRLPPASTE